MKIKREWFVWIGGLSLLLSSCAGMPASGEEILVEYRRSGGIAGSQVELVVSRDGSAVLTENGDQSNFRLDQDTYDRLLKALDDVDFSKLQAAYEPAQGGADLYTYEVTYEGQSVMATDTAIPAALQPVIDLLEEILQLKAQA